MFMGKSQEGTFSKSLFTSAYFYIPRFVQR